MNNNIDNNQLQQPALINGDHQPVTQAEDAISKMKRRLQLTRNTLSAIHSGVEDNYSDKQLAALTSTTETVKALPLLEILKFQLHNQTTFFADQRRFSTIEHCFSAFENVVHSSGNNIEAVWKRYIPVSIPFEYEAWLKNDLLPCSNWTAAKQPFRKHYGSPSNKEESLAKLFRMRIRESDSSTSGKTSTRGKATRDRARYSSLETQKTTKKSRVSQSIRTRPIDSSSVTPTSKTSSTAGTTSTSGTTLTSGTTFTSGTTHQKSTAEDYTVPRTSIIQNEHMFGFLTDPLAQTKGNDRPLVLESSLAVSKTETLSSPVETSTTATTTDLFDVFRYQLEMIDNYNRKTTFARDLAIEPHTTTTFKSILPNRFPKTQNQKKTQYDAQIVDD
ncbi:hypothetical protein MBANPS3_011514 [Mucor bainieri]